MGKQDIVFAGGGEAVQWTQSVLFDGMGALSSKYNDAPETASRPYDASRDGFVISGGGGTVVVEELEHAKARGAKIYAELVGYGATSDGYDMVQPSGEGAVRCMQQAMDTVDTPIDYINAHGTSTPVGDIRELDALREVFKDGTVPPVSSTKSLSGHALGAAGVHEAIYSLLMQENNFISASANITELDEGAAGVDIVREKRDADLTTIMSNSFGFGGTNQTLFYPKLSYLFLSYLFCGSDSISLNLSFGFYNRYRLSLPLLIFPGDIYLFVGAAAPPRLIHELNILLRLTTAPAKGGLALKRQQLPKRFGHCLPIFYTQLPSLPHNQPIIQGEQFHPNNRSSW